MTTWTYSLNILYQTLKYGNCNYLLLFVGIQRLNLQGHWVATFCPFLHEEQFMLDVGFGKMLFSLWHKFSFKVDQDSLEAVSPNTTQPPTW